MSAGKPSSLKSSTDILEEYPQIDKGGVRRVSKYGEEKISAVLHMQELIPSSGKEKTFTCYFTAQYVRREKGGDGYSLQRYGSMWWLCGYTGDVGDDTLFLSSRYQEKQGKKEVLMLEILFPTNLTTLRSC